MPSESQPSGGDDLSLDVLPINKHSILVDDVHNNCEFALQRPEVDSSDSSNLHEFGECHCGFKQSIIIENIRIDNKGKMSKRQQNQNSTCQSYTLLFFLERVYWLTISWSQILEQEYFSSSGPSYIFPVLKASTTSKGFQTILLFLLDYPKTSNKLIGCFQECELPFVGSLMLSYSQVLGLILYQDLVLFNAKAGRLGQERSTSTAFGSVLSALTSTLLLSFLQSTIQLLPYFELTNIFTQHLLIDLELVIQGFCLFSLQHYIYSDRRCLTQSLALSLLTTGFLCYFLKLSFSLSVEAFRTGLPDSLPLMLLNLSIGIHQPEGKTASVEGRRWDFELNIIDWVFWVPHLSCLLGPEGCEVGGFGKSLMGFAHEWLERLGNDNLGVILSERIVERGVLPSDCFSVMLPQYLGNNKQSEI